MKYLILLISGLVFITVLGSNYSKTEEFIFKTPAHFGNLYSIPADNQMSEAAIELGRMLFYDTRLSRDLTISCASCHQQAKAFTDGKASSIGIKGQQSKRSAMSLVNLLWSKKFFWDGRANSLEEQVFVPIQDHREMDMTLEELTQRLQKTNVYPQKFEKAFASKTITAENIAKAIAQFLRTLISANSRYDKIVKGEIQPTEREIRVINLFMTHPIPEANIRGGNCGDCHGSHLTTLHTFHNNGLDLNPKDLGKGAISGKKYDNGKMKTPSLRNIALTAPYMHDGRFQTLEEVLDHYNEHIQPSENLDPLIMEATNEIDGKGLQLTPQEKADIIFLLNMLTDEDFIKNKAFANPFEKK